MSTSEPRSSARARDVAVSDSEIRVSLMDGRTITVPLDWFPRLAGASRDARARWQLVGAGEGIHWPEIDEDISVEGMLAGKRSQGAA